MLCILASFLTDQFGTEPNGACGLEAAKYPITVMLTPHETAPTRFAVRNRQYAIPPIPATGGMNTRPHGT